MKVIKNINNNVSLCLDSKGREVIAFGKGLGFIKAPYDIPLSKIDRTFYNIKDTSFDAIKDIPLPILNASIRIVDEVEQDLQITFMSTAPLSLADHIHFAIQRVKKHIKMEMPVQEDLKQLYPKEMKEAQKALNIIKEETGITLNRNETSMIALHFIHNRVDVENKERIDSEEIINECVSLIEKEWNLSISIDSFNYSRFATHVDYLLKRTLKNDQIQSVNSKMFLTLKQEYPSTYVCACAISELLHQRLNITLCEEEQLYLMLHINRLCSREKGYL